MAKPSNPLPSQEVLQSLLRYEKETGILFWKSRPIEMFTDSERYTAAHSCAQWNARWADQPALTKVNKGYQCGRIFYQYVLAHRVIWKLVTGKDPDIIDHINGDSMDNRWANIRDVTEATNRRNVALRSDSRSGAVGVRWSDHTKKWIAHIQIGSFNTKEAAIAARKQAEALLGYHPNHGRIAVA